MAVVCRPVTNDRGNPSDAPCSGGWCGPLDLSSWQTTANEQLSRATSLRGNMTDAERSELDRLAALARDLPVGFEGATTQLANVAFGARCLADVVADRLANPPRPPSPPSSGGSSSSGGGITFPDLPDLPSGTGLLDNLFKGLGGMLPWVALALLLIYGGGGKGRR